MLAQLKGQFYKFLWRRSSRFSTPTSYVSFDQSENPLLLRCCQVLELHSRVLTIRSWRSQLLSPSSLRRQLVLGASAPLQFSTIAPYVTESTSVLSFMSSVTSGSSYFWTLSWNWASKSALSLQTSPSRIQAFPSFQTARSGFFIPARVLIMGSFKELKPLLFSRFSVRSTTLSWRLILAPQLLGHTWSMWPKVSLLPQASQDASCPLCHLWIRPLVGIRFHGSSLHQ